MSGTSIAHMDEPDFDFSDEARRVHIDPCGWSRPCDGYGEMRNIVMHNGLPKRIVLCKKHDEMLKEVGELKGEEVTDLAAITELMKLMLGTRAVRESPRLEIHATPEPEEPTAPILEFTDAPESPEPQKTEEKPSPTPGVYILAERPSPNHYFCVEDAKTGEPCNKWMLKKDFDWHAKSVHGRESYQNRREPKEDVECVRGDHKSAGCVMSFKTHGALSTHLSRTKLKFPPKPTIPHPASEPTPQQQPVDADHATT